MFPNYARLYDAIEFQHLITVNTASMKIFIHTRLLKEITKFTTVSFPHVRENQMKTTKNFGIFYPSPHPWMTPSLNTPYT